LPPAFGNLKKELEPRQDEKVTAKVGTTVGDVVSSFVSEFITAPRDWAATYA
jgi:hypothetical protein